MSEVKVNKISPKQTCTTVTLGDSGDDFVVATGVNFKTAAVKDAAGNVIVSRCGSNITIGSSGAAVALACGATQTGFGRTGTVDWDTTAKTANFTAVSGNGYFVNTTSGAITVTLPAGSAGSIVAVSDYASTAQTNNIIVAPNATDKINGVNNNYIISTQGLAVTLVYVDATKGWKSVTGSDADATGLVPAFVAATGGTVTCCGDYKIHTFTSPGTFTVTCAGNPAGSNTVDYLVVAGGGGGGVDGGAGGGAGGYRESSGVASGCYTTSPLGACVSALPVTATGYPITVGGGGSGSPQGLPGQGSSGNNSVFSTITSTAGGGGGGQYGPGSPSANGLPGGSGGGVGRTDSNPTAVAGSGNTPPVSPPQGNPGGSVSPTPSFAGGSGGGGATAAGAAGTSGGGNGGNGGTTSISTSPVAYGGGGGGAGHPSIGACGGAGGTGGGASGGPFSAPAGPATANRGGGGGGGAASGTNSSNGSSGIVIIRYKYQ